MILHIAGWQNEINNVDGGTDVTPAPAQLQILSFPGKYSAIVSAVTSHLITRFRGSPTESDAAQWGSAVDARHTHTTHKYALLESVTFLFTPFHWPAGQRGKSEKFYSTPYIDETTNTEWLRLRR